MSALRRFAQQHRAVASPVTRRGLVAAPRRSVKTMAEPMLAGDTFFLDDFCIRQFDDPNYSGSRISYDKAEFVAKIHEAHKNGAGLVDGYAPFCKHVFVENFVGAKVGALEITDKNKHLIHSGYTKRRPEELAVLTRLDDASCLLPCAACMCNNKHLLCSCQCQLSHIVWSPRKGLKST